MHRPTNEPWLHSKNQGGVTYFSGQNPLPQKVAFIFEPAELHSLLDICYLNKMYVL